MVFSVLTHPTKAFTERFDEPRIGLALVVVLLTALVTFLASYVFLSNYLAAGVLCLTSIIQWFVFTLIVWFFGFAHNGRMKSKSKINFSQIASVTGKLWTINFASSILMLIMALVLPSASDVLLLIVAAVMVILLIVLSIGWIISSIKMLKVVTGAKRGRLVINWLILIILNGVLLSFISLVLQWVLA